MVIIGGYRPHQVSRSTISDRIALVRRRTLSVISIGVCAIAIYSRTAQEAVIMSDAKYMIIRNADAALRAGNTEAAITGYRNALTIDPAMANIWYNLGYALRSQRQFADALDAYGKALDHGVSRPEEVYLNRAAIMSEQLDTPDSSLGELNLALQINPRFVSGWLNLGLLYEDMGQPTDARDAYNKVLEFAPENGRAMARLAAISIFEGQATDTAPRLEMALRMPTLPAEDAIDVAFGLANVYDAIGRHGQAFELAIRANRAQYEQLPAHLRYDPTAHEALVDALCRLRLPRPLETNDTNTAVPIFICGLFRSGSTLAEQLLARHSRTKPGGEFDFIPEMVRNGLQPYPEALEQANVAKFESLRRDYLSRLAATGYDGGPVSDKRCDNFLHIGLIKTLFPAAKIIHSIRAPLDNAVSLFFQHFADGINYSMDLDHLGHWMAQYRRLMTHWRAKYGPDIHDFCYDSTVRDPEPSVRAMVEHCGIEWHDHAEDANAVVKTASAWQVRQPLHRRSSGRWRNYARELAPVMQRAGIDDQGNWLQ